MLASLLPYQFAYRQLWLVEADNWKDRIECDPAKKRAKRGRVHISIDDATSLKFEFMFAVASPNPEYFSRSISNPDISAIPESKWLGKSSVKLSSSNATP
jgi:hypothetical protein